MDELLYRDQVEARDPRRRAGCAPARYVRAGARVRASTAGRRLALVYAVGDHRAGREPGRARFGGGLAGSDTIIRGLRAGARGRPRARDRPAVDSPGGSGTASDAIWREVRLARRVKPVVASMGDYAASGGYYIAMGRRRDRGRARHDHRLDRRLLREVQPARPLREARRQPGDGAARQERARSSRATSPGTRRERAQGARAQPGLLRHVREQGRRGTRTRRAAEIEAVAQGRVWTGQEALASGLVDAAGRARRGGRASRASARASAAGQERAARRAARDARASSRRCWSARSEVLAARASARRAPASLCAGRSALGDRRPDRAAAVRPARSARGAAVALAQARRRDVGAASAAKSLP